MLRAHTMVGLALITSCFTSTVYALCPPTTGSLNYLYTTILYSVLFGACTYIGIYLMHGGYCLPEYTVISDIALTADNPLHCVLAGSSGTGGGGQWTGPDNTSVQCGGSGSGPFNCSQSSDPTNITLYKRTRDPFSDKQQLYTCTISGQNISVQIKSE